MQQNTPPEEHDKTLLYFGSDVDDFRDVLRMHNIMTNYIFLLDDSQLPDMNPFKVSFCDLISVDSDDVREVLSVLMRQQLDLPSSASEPSSEA